MVTATCDALIAAKLPPMDERLKSMLAGQVGILLRGGWPLAEVRQAAIDLALAWDDKRGHNRVCHLAARMRAMDAEKRVAEHNEHKRIERAMVGGATPATSPHDPTLHDFSQDPAAPSNTCRFCRGPVGVHVRRRVDVA